MKTLRLLGLLVVVILMAAPVRAAAVDPQIAKEVREFLDQYEATYEKKDVAGLMKLIAPDPGVVFLDVDPQGRHVGPDQIKAAYERDIAGYKSAKGEYKNVSIGGKGDIAWFAADLALKVDLGDQVVDILGRWSGVLEKRDGKWLLIQSHFSFSEPEPPMLETTPQPGPQPAPQPPAK